MAFLISIASNMAKMFASKYFFEKVRNMCKDNELDVNLANYFKIIFNKWLVTLSNGLIKLMLLYF